MNAVLQRGYGSRGIRLLQDWFNVQSLSLYASLGFEVREPVVVMGGAPRDTQGEGVAVRPLAEGDVEACSELCRGVHGFERTTELQDALRSPAFSPVVATRGGRVAGVGDDAARSSAACAAVAETEEDMLGLILGTLQSRRRPSVVPAANATIGSVPLVPGAGPSRRQADDVQCRWASAAIRTDT